MAAPGDWLDALQHERIEREPPLSDLSAPTTLHHRATPAFGQGERVTIVYRLVAALRAMDLDGQVLKPKVILVCCHGSSPPALCLEIFRVCCLVAANRAAIMVTSCLRRW